MKKLFILNIFICLILTIVSCSKDFLDTKPLDRFSEIDVFSDPVLTEAYVNGIFNSTKSPINGFMGVLKAAFGDEIHDQWYDFYDFGNSNITSDDLQDWLYDTWEFDYPLIRKCDIFFEKVENVKFDNTVVDGKTRKERLTGEVHFLRAFLYHQLVSLYGGVPIINKPFAISDNLLVPRNTYSECIDFIVQECDLAASLLPEVNTGNNNGLPTKGAALALKSEVLLYAASDLHNNNSLISGFSNPELLGYTSGDPQARWLAAKNAAKEVINLNLYSLFRAEPAQGDSIAQNFVDLFIANNTEEDIYVKFFNKKEGGYSLGAWFSNYGNNLGCASGPNGYHLFGQNTPTGNIVDAYAMADGSPFNWNNPSHAAMPYKNREPRFYASILYDGAKWRPRPEDVAPIDPLGVIQTGTWEKWNSEANSMFEVPGLDTRSSPIDGYNGGFTGYYLRKFVDPTIDAQYVGQEVPWRYFRYTEILLNYAEACIELHEDGEARTYINMIRKRAGMPDVTESGTALRDRYRNERRIEMAFEGNRFYDCRRWVTGPETYVDLTGVDIRYKLNPDYTTATIPTIQPKLIQTRTWLDKAYFFPIMRDEMNKDNLLIQNPGY